ncbi:PREDICTED: transcription factor 7-like 1-B [Cyprinodon variegatus]|uniref:transcription factor 7-like 1-B n=1 Tax=Cyprinodon variegatus TaxID=28743 RepID=UPI000742A4D8|nr:PREDICTED: transcription factor 7-like 1-B [Cyprinodon variegatus]
MPQLSGDDLGANDELLAFKDEGEQEGKPNVSSERDLDDVKSSLVNESETPSSPDSEADRRPPHPDAESSARLALQLEEGRRRLQGAGLYQPSPYVSYPFFMIPDLGNLCSPYLANGALTSSGRTYLPFQWPLLDLPGRAGVRDSAAPTHLVGPAHTHTIQTLNRTTSCLPVEGSASKAAFFNPGPQGSVSVQTAAGRRINRVCFSVCRPGQTMYPMAGGFSPAALAVNASMSSLMSSSFSPHLVPTSQPSLLRPPMVPAVKQEPGCSTSQQPGRSSSSSDPDKEEERKPHIKKPLNAFMLYMREERPKVVAQCNVKESATINQILGQRWHSLSKDQQATYYDLARKERLLHSKLYPNWSARDNYGKKKKRKRMKSETKLEVAAAEEDCPPQMKKPREEQPPTRTHPPSATHPPSVSHLTHTHLSQASPASSLDSPATPTMSLASPAAPAATHTEHTLSSYSSPYGEQLQPLSLTTKPGRPPHTMGPPSTDTSTSSPPSASSRRSPHPFLPPSHLKQGAL